MKLTLISDTHMRHDELGTLSGDVLIHCGDLFNLFERNMADLRAVDAWFARQRFDLILCIGGNHDHLLEDVLKSNDQPFKHAVYLQDRRLVYHGVTFYGSPWVPFLPTHAFHADKPTLKQKWANIPADADVLITHTPPQNIFDLSSRGHQLGCRQLARRIAQITPKVHCFGHVHASGGQQTINGTKFANASNLDRAGGPLRSPIQIKI